MKSKEEKILEKYIPSVAIQPIISLYKKHGFALKITRNRTTKMGDYRPPQNGHGHRITVNRGLNEYAFLITLVHEIAHLITWQQHKRRAKPHGKEWKTNFGDLLKYFIRLKCFPNDLSLHLEEYLRKPTAASCSDERLVRLLRDYDEDPAILLEEIREGAIFETTNGRQFKKENKRRKRFICEEIATGRKYLFSPVAQVRLLK